MYTNISSTYDPLWKEFWIPWSDITSKCLLLHALEWARKRTDDLMGVWVIPSWEPIHEYLKKLGEASTRQAFRLQEVTFYSEYFIPIISALILKIKQQYEIPAERFLTILKLVKKLSILFCSSKTLSNNPMIVEDSTGYVFWDKKKDCLTLTIDLDSIMKEVAVTSINDWIKLSIYEQFVMVLTHELAHVFSTEFISTDEAEKREKELAIRELYNESHCVNDIIVKYFTHFRSWYKIIYVDGYFATREDPTPFNEAITELVGEELYQIITSDEPFKVLTKTYHVGAYKPNVIALHRAIKRYCSIHKMDESSVLEKIKRAYIVWFPYILEIDDLYSLFLEEFEKESKKPTLEITPPSSLSSHSPLPRG